MNYAQRKIKAEEILNHAEELKRTSFNYEDVYGIIEDYNNIADNKSLIKITQLRNLLYSQQKLEPILKRVIINLKAFINAPAPKTRKKIIYAILFVVFSVFFSTTTFVLYNNYSNSIEKNQNEYYEQIKRIHLAESILFDAKNIDINDSNTGYKAASCINDYNQHAKEFNLPQTFPYIEGTDIDPISKKLRNNGITKINTVVHELTGFVNAEKELLKSSTKLQILKETILGNKATVILTISSFLGDLCTILSFLLRYLIKTEH